jgi:hypothetical protein
MAKATPEQAKAGIDAWMSWAKKAQGSIVDLGAPLGNGQTLGQAPRKDNSTVVGHSILQSTSKEAPFRPAQRSPASADAGLLDRGTGKPADALYVEPSRLKPLH